MQVVQALMFNEKQESPTFQYLRVVCYCRPNLYIRMLCLKRNSSEAQTTSPNKNEAALRNIRMLTHHFYTTSTCHVK